MTEEDRIDFNYEDVSIPGFDETKTRAWIKLVITEEGYALAGIQIIFCTDEKLLAINRQYLDHDTLTDVITFNYNDEFDGVAGDIFISYERVVENARDFGISVPNELHRVIIHGVLHLLGFDDGTTADILKIREKENYYLTLLS